MLFAAGLGTRLKPFTDKHPKALARVNDTTLLEHSIRYLQKHGINDVVVNVHHFADQIENELSSNNGFGSNITISDERDEVLAGTSWVPPLHQQGAAVSREVEGRHARGPRRVRGHVLVHVMVRQRVDHHGRAHARWRLSPLCEAQV